MATWNHLAQPIGESVSDWTPRPMPSPRVFQGSWGRVEPLDALHHSKELFAANQLDSVGRMWTYLPYGPFENLDTYRQWVAAVAHQPDPLFFALCDADGHAVGVASYLRIDPNAGTIEVGHLAFSPTLQGTTAATEAMIVLARHVFVDLGYRRYEWKCDSLNAPSRRAAERLGFMFEGIFRQANVTKGRNRDTAWYSIIDREWPLINTAYTQWLKPENFDHEGRQRSPLSQLTGSIRAKNHDLPSGP